VGQYFTAPFASTSAFPKDYCNLLDKNSAGKFPPFFGSDLVEKIQQSGWEFSHFQRC
jgi:hypothetical protein